jgi:hypothetical protein
MSSIAELFERSEAFQGLMDADERHATGAYYTGEEDIMRVVGPTIVEPWRARIDAATTLAELSLLHEALTKFRVLDPACGSGNFLCVAYRELYRLETALLRRMQELTGAAISSSSGISISNFHGIDINPLAVELARRELGMMAEPTPLLDSLEANIICADALFVDWPEVDAIVGNPPILGSQKIRDALGERYLARLKALGAEYVADLSCYWFRLAHDRLPIGGRAGLVGTSGLRVGKARSASLDYLVARGGTITNAVSSMPWPGDAALDVCVVNWVKGRADGPHQLIVDGHTHACMRIATHLQLHADVSSAIPLRANAPRSMMGVTFGSPLFTTDGDAAGFPRAADNKYVRPIATGTAMLTGALERDPAYGIYMVDCPTARDAAALGGDAFAYLEQHLQTTGRWWEPERPRREFVATVERLHRYIACSNPQARPIFVFLSTAFVPTNTLQAFALDDDYSFGILQSNMHWRWLVAKGGKVRADFRYTTAVWKTFAWPQQATEQLVAKVAAAARELRATRRELMAATGASLRALHQAADAPLVDAQARLDDAVAAAYELPAGHDPLEFLLDLDLALANDENQGRRVCGPGLPPGFDPNDPRWTSKDCVEPPPREAAAVHSGSLIA